MTYTYNHSSQRFPASNSAPGHQVYRSDISHCDFIRHGKDNFTFTEQVWPIAKRLRLEVNCERLLICGNPSYGTHTWVQAWHAASSHRLMGWEQGPGLTRLYLKG